LIEEKVCLSNFSDEWIRRSWVINSSYILPMVMLMSI